jgi:hypothetical protein
LLSGQFVGVLLLWQRFISHTHTNKHTHKQEQKVNPHGSLDDDSVALSGVKQPHNNDHNHIKNH